MGSINPFLKCDDLDDILGVLGGRGKYQKVLLYLVVVPITAILPFLTLSEVFLLYQPDHWCLIDQEVKMEDYLLNETHSSQNEYFDDDIGNNSSNDHKCTFGNETFPYKNECPLGWEYDQSEYKSTIVTDFNWVCNKAMYPIQSFAIKSMGNAVGAIFFGHLADKYGRKFVFFLCLIVNIGSRFGALYLPANFPAFLAMLFLTGTAFPMVFLTPSMIVAEMCDKEYRSWVYSLSWIVWVVGMTALPVFAWLANSWFLIGLVTTIPGIPLLLSCFRIPESPRWLLLTGRLGRAARVLRKIAKTNGTANRFTNDQLKETLDRLRVQQQLINKSGSSLGFWTLFSKLKVAKRTLLLIICWSVNLLVYYEMVFNTGHMWGNHFVNFFILSVMELPAGLGGSFIVEKFGRRWTQVLFLVLSAGAFVSTVIATEFLLSFPVVQLVTISIAKLCINLSFLVVNIQGGEIFPTQLRSTGVSLCSTIGAFCGMLGPYIVALGDVRESYPYAVLAALCLVGAFCATFIPETMNRKLPETIDDMACFAENDTFWSYRPSDLDFGRGMDSIATISYSVSAETVSSNAVA